MTSWNLNCDGWACRSLVALTIALAVTMIICWLAPLHPLLEAVTNVRAQLVPLLIVPVVGFLVMQRWQFAAAAFALLAINGAYLLPYVGSSPEPAGAGVETITVMQYNIFFGNNDYDAIVAHIAAADADVVALHELLPRQWQELDARLADYPYRIAEPLAEVDGQPGGGMALLSRTPLDRVDVDAEMSPTDRVTLVATTSVDGEVVTIVGLHPHASRTDSRKVDLRARQMAGVVMLVERTETPVIVLTDLNMTPTSPLYQDFLDDLGWQDPHRSVGWQASWPTWGGPFGLPIDHVLMSNEFEIHEYSTGDGAGSDHKSVVAELSLTSG